MSNPLSLDPTFQVVYRGKMFEIVHFEGKPGITFEAAVRSPGVRLLIECDVPSTGSGPSAGSKGLLMTKEIRREASGVDYRLPGGKVFDSLGELDAFRDAGGDMLSEAERAAAKEGREEAGVSGGTMSFVSVARAGASIEWDLYYFRLEGAAFGDQELEEAEQGDIETVRLSAREIFDRLAAGEVQEGRSADVLWRWLATSGSLSFRE